jgi:hypothetical protein
MAKLRIARLGEFAVVWQPALHGLARPKRRAAHPDTLLVAVGTFTPCGPWFESRIAHVKPRGQKMCRPCS